MTDDKIYISIGNNCYPRIYIKNNLNMSKEGGYKTCPFDLCVNTYDSVYKSIETDFSLFFENLRLKEGSINADGDRSKCGPGGNNITNAYGTIFNHEGSTHSHIFKEGRNDDDYYIRNDFEMFRKRYSQRIANWKNYINTYKNIVFVCHKYTSQQVENLTELFKNKYKDNIISILNIPN